MFLFIIWIWLLFAVVADIFRSEDLSGWAKALWSIFVICLPYLGIFVYLIARGGKMHEHALTAAQAQDQAMRSYIKDVATTNASPADELARLPDLRDKSVINDDEFQQLKARWPERPRDCRIWLYGVKRPACGRRLRRRPRLGGADLAAGLIGCLTRFRSRGWPWFRRAGRRFSCTNSGDMAGAPPGQTGYAPSLS